MQVVMAVDLADALRTKGVIWTCYKGDLGNDHAWKMIHYPVVSIRFQAFLRRQ